MIEDLKNPLEAIIESALDSIKKDSKIEELEQQLAAEKEAVDKVTQALEKMLKGELDEDIQLDGEAATRLVRKVEYGKIDGLTTQIVWQDTRKSLVGTTDFTLSGQKVKRIDFNNHTSYIIIDLVEDKVKSVSISLVEPQKPEEVIDVGENGEENNQASANITEEDLPSMFTLEGIRKRLARRKQN